MTFSQKTLQYIQPGSKVLDLGAGDGWFSQQALEQDALVTAVDAKAPKEQLQGIDWHVVKVQDFINKLQSQDQFNIIFSRNLIQFLDSNYVLEKLLPALTEHLQSEGILAIQTFYQDPEPPFENKVSSLFTPLDIKGALSSFHVLSEKQFEDDSVDMKGIPRKFFITNIILQKQ